MDNKQVRWNKPFLLVMIFITPLETKPEQPISNICCHSQNSKRVSTSAGRDNFKKESNIDPLTRFKAGVDSDGIEVLSLSLGFAMF